MLNEKKVLMTGLILLILFSGIGIVSAETLTGTLGSSGLNTTTYTMPAEGTGGQTVASITNLYIKDIQYTMGIAYLIRWDINAVPTFTGGSPVGNTTPVIYKIGATQIGTGTFGYQRIFNGAGVEQGGYQYLIFNSDWVGGLNYTGNQGVTVQGIPINGIGYTSYFLNDDVLPFSGAMKFGTSANGWYGIYSLQKNLNHFSDYSATKPSGIGISGYISKTSGGTTYPGRAWVFDGTSGITVASESTLSSTQLNFTTSSSTIKIGVQDSQLNWYNTSILFVPTTPTITPTPTVTPVDPFGITPPGYIRSMCQNTDQETDGAVHYSNMSIRDVQNSSWNNVTSRFDGTWYIDTLPNHTIDCYGSAPGYTSASRLGLPASQSMMYELFLFPGYVPPASSGKVRLYVLVNDRQTSAPINGALVTISGSGQTSVSQTTGKTGDVVLEWANLSTVYATASKYGYTSASRTLTTTANGPDTLRIELDKTVITVAPTSTIPPGGVTPAVTMDTRSSSEKDIAMMDMIRSAGPQLISIAIAATAFGLLGLIMKSMKF